MRGRWFLGEHPLPGPGSFEAGGAILDFFDSLRRSGVTELWVFLSGGASSLAWVPTVPRRELRERLEHLYALPLSIQQLNAERSRLCALKHGGAARWLRRLSPGTRARVLLISDVHPFGPGVVGSGPFWERGVPHRVLADNRTCVAAIASEARRRQQPVLWTGSGRVDSWQQWVKTLESQVRRFVAEGRSGVLILGGEPAVALEHSGKPRRGGRMSHLAAALGLALFDVFEKHELEVLCMSSDGVDGTSGASGALLGAEFRRRALSSRGAASRAKLAWAVENHETARVLRDWKLLFPAAPTGTNVQDCVVISLASPLL